MDKILISVNTMKGSLYDGSNFEFENSRTLGE